MKHEHELNAVGEALGKGVLGKICVVGRAQVHRLNFCRACCGGKWVDQILVSFLKIHILRMHPNQS